MVPDTSPMSEDTETSTIGTASAKELAAVVGPRPIADLRPHEPELAAAVSELARASGHNWLRGQDDPLVVLLRAVARLSLIAPDVRSQRATWLIDTLEGNDEPDTGRRTQRAARRFARPTFVSAIPQVG